MGTGLLRGVSRKYLLTIAGVLSAAVLCALMLLQAVAAWADDEGDEGDAVDYAAVVTSADGSEQGYNTLADAFSGAGAGSIVTVQKDISDTSLMSGTSSYILIKQSGWTTLDLNGHDVDLGSRVLYLWTGLVVKDSTATQEPAVGTDCTVSYEAGVLKSTGAVVTAYNGGRFVLESGCVESTKSNALCAGAYAGAAPSIGHVDVAGGYVKAQEFGVVCLCAGSTATVSGGVVYTVDNAVVGGNGTKNSTRDYGGTTITISGGTLIGNITTKNYASAGVYHPQSGTLNISGGEIISTNGPGVVMRAGSLNMTGGTVVARGTGNGWVGDKKTKLPPAGIVDDRSAKYPGASDEDTTAVSGGTVSAPEGAPALQTLLAEGQSTTFSVTGGSFSSEVPADYCAEGTALTRSQDGSYGVAVCPEPAASMTDAQGATRTYATLADAFAAAGDGATVKVLTVISSLERSAIVRSGVKVTLDLNDQIVLGGDACEYLIGIERGAVLTLESSAQGRMMSTSLGPSSAAVRFLDSGDESGASALEMMGGTLQGGSYGVVVDAAGAFVNVHGGSIVGTAAGVCLRAADASVVVDGALVKGGTDGVAVQDDARGAQVSVVSGSVSGGAAGIDQQVAGAASVSGGVVSGGSNGISMSAGRLDVFGGGISGEDAGILAYAGAVSVTGGSVESTAASGVAVNVCGADALAVLSGGTVVSAENARDVAAEEGRIEISGGYFAHLVEEEYCEAGYVPVYDPVDIEGASFYTVVQGVFVARVVNGDAAVKPDRGYTALAAAIDAAHNGDTVALLADITASILVADKQITLDLNGKTLHASAGKSALTVLPDTEVVIKGENGEDKAFGGIEGAAGKYLVSTLGTVRIESGRFDVAAGGRLFASSEDEGVKVRCGTFNTAVQTGYLDEGCALQVDYVGSNNDLKVADRGYRVLRASRTASVTVTGATYSFATLKGAAVAARSIYEADPSVRPAVRLETGASIDASTDGKRVDFNAPVAFDLNGKTLTIADSCKLFFTDRVRASGAAGSYALGNGRVVSRDACKSVVVGSVLGAVDQLEIDGVEFTTDGAEALAVQSGTVVSTHSTYLSTAGQDALQAGYNSTNPSAAALNSAALITVNGESARLRMEDGAATVQEAAGGSYTGEGIYGIYVSNGGHVKLGAAGGTGPTILSNYAAVAGNNLYAPVHVEICGGTYQSTVRALAQEAERFDAAIYMPGDGELSIYGGSFEGQRYALSVPYSKPDIALHVSGGVFASGLAGEASAGAAAVYFGSSESTKGGDYAVAESFDFTGGTFEGATLAFDAGDDGAPVVPADVAGKLAFAKPADAVGPLFTATDAAEYIKGGVLTPNGDGHYRIGAFEDMVARCAGVYHATLRGAIDAGIAAGANPVEVVLVRDNVAGEQAASDITQAQAVGSGECVVVRAGENVAIDLNGHRLSGTQSPSAGASWADVIGNYGTVTIADSSSKAAGAVVGGASGAAALVNYAGATATVKGGAFPADGGHAVRNMGTMLFPADTTAVVSGPACNGWTGDEATDRGTTAGAVAELSVRGGWFEAAAGALENGARGSVEVAGGLWRDHDALDTYVVEGWSAGSAPEPDSSYFTPVRSLRSVSLQEGRGSVSAPVEAPPSFVYTGASAAQHFVGDAADYGVRYVDGALGVSDEDRTRVLAEGADYSYEFRKAVDNGSGSAAYEAVDGSAVVSCGAYQFVVKGADGGAYADERVFGFTVTKADISGYTVELAHDGVVLTGDGAGSVVYNGLPYSDAAEIEGAAGAESVRNPNVVTVTISAPDGSPVLGEGDYEASWSANTEPGTAGVSVFATGSNYTGAARATFTITRATLSDENVSVRDELAAGDADALPQLMWTGSTLAPRVSVVVDGPLGEPLPVSEGADYTLAGYEYAADDSAEYAAVDAVKDVGRYRVSVAGAGTHYSGEATAYFEVVKTREGALAEQVVSDIASVAAAVPDGASVPLDDTVLAAASSAAQTARGHYAELLELLGDDEARVAAFNELIGAERFGTLGAVEALVSGTEAYKEQQAQEERERVSANATAVDALFTTLSGTVALDKKKEAVAAARKEFDAVNADGSATKQYVQTDTKDGDTVVALGTESKLAAAEVKLGIVELQSMMSDPDASADETFEDNIRNKLTAVKAARKALNDLQCDLVGTDSLDALANADTYLIDKDLRDKLASILETLSGILSGGEDTEKMRENLDGVVADYEGLVEEDGPLSDDQVLVVQIIRQLNEAKATVARAEFDDAIAALPGGSVVEEDIAAARAAVEKARGAYDALTKEQQASDEVVGAMEAVTAAAGRVEAAEKAANSAYEAAVKNAETELSSAASTLANVVKASSASAVAVGTWWATSAEWAPYESARSVVSQQVAAAKGGSESRPSRSELASSVSVMKSTLATLRSRLKRGESTRSGASYSTGSGTGAASYQVVTRAASATSTGTVVYRQPASAATAPAVNVPAWVSIGSRRYSVVRIADGAFANCKKLKTVTVAGNVTEIGAGVFRNAKSVTAVTLGTNVRKIGANAFKSAVKLKTLNVKSAKLSSKASVKNALKGSKIKTVKVSCAKASKKKVVKAFKKYGGKKKGVKIK